MGWRRLGLTAGMVLVCTGMLVIGVLVTAGGIAAILSRAWNGTAAAWLVIELLIGGAFIGFSCRLLMVGTYVCGHGLRVRTPLRTLTVSWSVVLGVRTQKITRLTSGPLQIVTARQVCVDLVDGQTVELPLQGTLHGERRPWRMSDILSAAEFDRLLAELRHRHHTQGRRHETNR
ncbi:PH domain-containing protein [Actinophytocola sp. NPDC049390]|uniref:PH domain-containing protein n=1 Tax=Actinophytocola sp. NPDC049390 TaxID=3363894 RepID=UPI0037AB2AAE